MGLAASFYESGLKDDDGLKDVLIILQSFICRYL